MFGQRKKKKQPRNLGLALGGGGARGFAHIGAISELLDAGLEFSVISGTSAGSLVGAMLAYGLTPREMTDLSDTLSVKDFRTNVIPFMASDAANIEEYAARILGDAKFSDLKIPFYAVTVDIRTGRQIILSSGSVARAVSASCAVPGIFKPVVWEDFHLVDGGLLNSVPSDVCRLHGADVVIAVDVNAGRGKGTDGLGALDVLQASVRIMSSLAAVSGRTGADILICPELDKYSASKKDGYLEMIAHGRDAARRMLPDIRALLHGE